MMDKKSPYRFTIKFNPNITEQKMASDLLNSRPDKASYLAAAILLYEQSSAQSPTLRNIYSELQEVKQLLKTNSVQLTAHTASYSAQASDKKSTPADNAGKDLLKNMIGSFTK